MPSATSLLISARMKSFASPKPASGPVSGAVKPILTVPSPPPPPNVAAFDPGGRAPRGSRACTAGCCSAASRAGAARRRRAAAVVAARSDDHRGQDCASTHDQHAPPAVPVLRCRAVLLVHSLSPSSLWCRTAGGRQSDDSSNVDGVRCLSLSISISAVTRRCCSSSRTASSASSREHGVDENAVLARRCRGRRSGLRPVVTSGGRAPPRRAASTRSCAADGSGTPRSARCGSAGARRPTPRAGPARWRRPACDRGRSSAATISDSHARSPDSMACRSARPSISQRATVRSSRSSTDRDTTRNPSCGSLCTRPCSTRRCRPFADRADAAAVALGQLGEGQACTRAEIAVEDVGAKLRVHLLGSRCPARHPGIEPLSPMPINIEIFLTCR